MARQVLENGVILPAEYSDDWYDDMTSNLTKLDDVIGSDSEKLSSADVGAAALSNNYNDLDNLPTIPTVNDATLTIQKNGVDVQTFTANASSNVTANIIVPTKTSDLTNDSNFVDTSNAAVSSGITSAKVTDYDTHIADTDIHVTTADKNKWNNQSYVFRYSSTALTASSTNSNALLDNTDNLKVGDKVIDSSGVLFSVTAIDTQNSTFTIGTALVDLAQDSDVVHLSGNETKNGELTLSKLNTNSIQSATGYIQIQSIGTNRSCSMFNGASSGDGGGFWCYGKDSANGSDCRMQIYNTSKSRYERVDLVNSQFLPTPSGELDCGGTSNKWKSINGLNPGSLSLPDLSNGIDISSYLDVSQSSTNYYTPPANGWISISINTPVRDSIQIECGGGFRSSVLSCMDPDSPNNYIASIIVPCIKNDTATIYFASSRGGTIKYAYFYSCQGNV